MQKRSLPRLAVVREGLALIYIPDPRKAVTGGRLEPAWLDVFYNPAMEFNRDLSVAAARVLLREMRGKYDLRVLDAHGGTGVRGVRYLLEAGAEEAIINDISGDAAALAHENARLNGVSDKVRITISDSNALMYRLKREEPTPVAMIDVDPYGSPAPFLHAALDLAGHGTIVAVTATDLAVLEGARAPKAYRRYLVKLERTPASKEVAVRALLAFMARIAAIYDKSITPLISVYADHYVRIVVRVLRGAKRAEGALALVGSAYYCGEEGWISFSPHPCKGGLKEIGPLWKGPLGDPQLLYKLEREVDSMEWLGTRQRLRRVLGIISSEYSLSNLTIYYSIAGVSSALRVSMPSRRAVIEELESMGYRAVETHFSPEGVRSDAPPSVFASVIARLTPSRRRP